MFDTHTHWSALDPTKVVIRHSGYYEIIGWARWAPGDGTRGVAVKKNGAASPVAESRGYVQATEAMLSVIAIEKLGVDDWLQLELYCLGVYPDDGGDRHSLTVVRLA